MSSRFFKRARALAFHAEYGAYIPGMLRSGAKLRAMDLTKKQIRRLDKMSLRRIQKELIRDSRT